VEKSKLVILSERNILKYLLSVGLKPYAFYTDFDKFKSKAQYFDNCTVLVIFSGACAFSIKQVCDYIHILESRANDNSDEGIRKVVVFSDFSISNLTDYYKFEDTILHGVRYSGKKLYVPEGTSIIKYLKITSEEVDLLDILDYEPSERVEEIFLEVDSYKNACITIKDKMAEDLAIRNKIKIPSWKYVKKS
jgi:hypothetical protein